MDIILGIIAILLIIILSPVILIAGFFLFAGIILFIFFIVCLIIGVRDSISDFIDKLTEDCKTWLSKK